MSLAIRTLDAESFSRCISLDAHFLDFFAKACGAVICKPSSSLDFANFFTKLQALSFFLGVFTFELAVDCAEEDYTKRAIGGLRISAFQSPPLSPGNFFFKFKFYRVLFV